MLRLSTLLLATLTFALPLRAQIHSSLYGEALREALVIDYAPASVLSSAASKDTLYAVIDRATVDGQDGTIGLYTGLFVPFDCNPSCDPSQDVFNQPNENTQGINQEHTWPRSEGAGSGLAERDMHHLFPTKVNVNSARASLPFGEIDDALTTTWYVLGQSQSSPPPEDERDAWSELRVNIAFEPREEKKGDLARAMFYFYTMYGLDGTGQASDSFFEAMKETLLAWHEADLPTAGEIARSERVANYQSTGSSEPAINPFVHDATLARRAYFVAPVVYVRADAEAPPIAQSGVSWTDAYTDLQRALTLKDSYGFVEEVWVAEGTYYPTSGNDRDRSFELHGGLALFGGFDGTETTLEERDWETNLTVLSGELGDPNESDDNSYHVVTVHDVEGIVVIDGFTVRDGSDTNNPLADATRGAGVYVLNSSSVTLQNAVVTNHIAGRSNPSPITGEGAGIYVGASSLFLENVLIADNTASSEAAGWGGGMLITSGSDASLTNVTFDGNRALGPWGGAGGGLTVNAGSTAQLIGMRFESNEVFGVYGRGGGLFCGESTCRLQDVAFIRNKANNLAHGAGLMVGPDAEASLINARFYGNGGAGGGAISTVGKLSISNAIFAGNYTYQGGPQDIDGGAGILAFEGSEVDLFQVVATENAAFLPDEGASGLQAEAGATVSLSNVIFWRNRFDEIYAEGEVLMNQAIVDDEYDGALDADPLFVRRPSRGDDGDWGTEDDDYGDLHLQAGSPAIDFGQSEFLPPDIFDLDGDDDTDEPLPFDLDGSPRVQGNAPDLGAYESPFAVVNEPSAGLPQQDDLAPIYPNPSRAQATLMLSLASPREAVRVEAFDLLGRRVALLHDGPLAAGRHPLTLDSTRLPAGVYVVRSSAAGFTAARRVVVLR